MTDHFKIIKEILPFIDLQSVLLKDIKIELETEDNNADDTKKSRLLEAIFELSQSNAGKNKYAYRFSEYIKDVGVYLYILGGRHLYETLVANLPGIFPSLSGILKHLHKSQTQIEECSLNLRDLKDFLLKRNLPMKVILSEDGTKITGNVQYDPCTDQLIGLLPKIHSITGMPRVRSYPCESATNIDDYIQHNEMSTYVYTVMAQPVVKNAPSFCIQLFGTNNSFTAQDVLHRWRYYEHQFKEEGIEIVAFCADGDPRLLKAMKIKNNLSGFSPNAPIEWKDFFAASFTPQVLCFQDAVHLGGKLKNRLFTKNPLLIGKSAVSIVHLKHLCEIVPKNVHGLCLGELENIDKMNYGVVQKITSDQVLGALDKHIKDSQGTVEYLKFIKWATLPFLEYDQKTLAGRINDILTAVFFARGWRNDIKKTPGRTLKNFITSNAYESLELNAHSLLNHTVMDGHIDLTLFSSQTCEKFFRHARALGPTQSTQINFSMLDFVHKVRRIQFQEEVQTKLDKRFIFPRNKSSDSSSPTVRPAVPTIAQIQAIAKNAQRIAKSSLRKLGVTNISFKQDMKDPDYGEFNSHKEQKEDLIECASLIEDPDDQLTADEKVFMNVFGSEVVISDLSQSQQNPSVFEYETSGGKANIRKSLVVWLLKKKKVEVSVDRRKRFN